MTPFICEHCTGDTLTKDGDCVKCGRNYYDAASAAVILGQVNFKAENQTNGIITSEQQKLHDLEKRVAILEEKMEKLRGD
jgi:hypothetical protein